MITYFGTLTITKAVLLNRIEAYYIRLIRSIHSTQPNLGYYHLPVPKLLEGNVRCNVDILLQFVAPESYEGAKKELLELNKLCQFLKPWEFEYFGKFNN